jgi:hypothetical protein
MNERTKHKLGGLKAWKEGLKTQEGTLIVGCSLKRNCLATIPSNLCEREVRNVKEKLKNFSP